ncbi:MAG: phosphopentomutase [Clostridia bacterium]|nr:phosphopentomutase [Clostridia bacterium]MBQ9702964.1 phosphopentomutase [Clostridia bacterium]
MRRIFLIVLDSFGIGALPDARLFNDESANTLRGISTSKKLSIPNLISLGLGNIDGVDCIDKSASPLGAYGRMAELSMGKDTTVGHFEISGLTLDKPFPTYPNGFSEEILNEFSKRCRRGVLCNKPYSGTEVIKDYGIEHMESGKLIVYTSADSVFQIAAHEDIVDVDTLYEYCKIAREILVGENGVARVIARPFTGEYPFVRTANRRDFSLPPPKKTVLDALKDKGYDVISVGKIYDIFVGNGITEYHLTHSNNEGIEKTIELMKKDFCGLCFINLVDFDMLYGHRNDIDGYASALTYFDSKLPHILSQLCDDDMLIITADHGCDPSDISTDHTREYVPLLVYGKGILPKNLGTLPTFSDISATISHIFGLDYKTNGTSFRDKIISPYAVVRLDSEV